MAAAEVDDVVGAHRLKEAEVGGVIGSHRRAIAALPNAL